MNSYMNWDITILTDRRYVDPTQIDVYTQNVLDEDNLLKEALESKGLRVTRTNWDNPNFDWASTRYVIFRTTWDYFDRFPEFEVWLAEVEKVTQLINPKELIYWNIDKHYLKDLEDKGVALPPTIFIEPGDQRTLKDIVNSVNWKQYILKPAIAGAARHTYKLSDDSIDDHEAIYSELIANESMLLQEFQSNVPLKGEVSYMVFGGKFSHAVLKKAKSGDFRVQDDFGGTVHHYEPSPEEIAFAENAVKACEPRPLYARVDVIWDNNNALAIGELEMIEPELWFRMNDQSADRCAEAIIDYIS